MGMDIGGILKQRRQRREETLEEVAYRAGTDAGNLSRIERNRQDVSVQRLGRLCAALEMSLTELFEELEGHTKTPHLRDPAAAFDKETRELISIVSALTPSRRRLLMKIAEDVRDSKGLS
ncbi:helix-turn-helix domain-containing protein [Alloalcanivorax gelatiniphagus]|uniref:Helix-turn-helix transcriptional regulator n=1 Tax=Alloalcanivorax gelatiniphagus TaxID=1194167 RepID=A0ABY2XIH3_9GAMM|nr:helix-turn-helix transcriptional regulator [Alloalcanivorax gelatiniphagus]TMW11637.1 helix-turn-helix transcriptional regulator [Alloalcanivorax gelatiniphagus]|tara:strand:+ start:31456 stop:31815 length:360 start_codon:yes stop_codon:yes gene_type:complete